MNKLHWLVLPSLIIVFFIGAIYTVFNYFNSAPVQTIKYFISKEETTKYCNGADMDSAGYQKTITIEKTAPINKTELTRDQIIKETILAATDGMCRTVMQNLNITEKDGVVYIPPIDAWAGVSITMCSCKPQIEVNVLRIPGVTNIIWQSAELVENFEGCVAAGNAVMESYPRQCRHQGQLFIEAVGNELQKADLIQLESPRPNQIVSSPFIVKGRARGSWFFEASFPVFLTDWDGRIIAEGLATAKGNWMTSEFVPFEATLAFKLDKDIYSNRGTLILRKDNPSGLPEHDDALEIPLKLE